MSNEANVTDKDLFKTIGQLEEATETMKSELKESAQNEEEIVGFFTIVGRILKGIFER